MFLRNYQAMIVVLGGATAMLAQARQESPQPGALPQQGQAAAVEASAKELVEAYRTNVAFADDKYTDKQVAVTGQMMRITGIRVTDGAVYLFEMAPGTSDSREYLTFRFTDAERKALAPLKPEQVVTIQGLCKGLAPKDAEGRQAVYFWDCRLIKVGK